MARETPSGSRTRFLTFLRGSKELLWGAVIPVVPNTIASVLLHIRDVTGLMPHIYFRWTEGNPSATCCASPRSVRAK